MVNEKLFVDETLLVLIGVAVNFNGFDHAEVLELVLLTGDPAVKNI
jgi:hypothetical protein